MNGQTVILSGPVGRERAKLLIDHAPLDAVCNIAPAKRTTEQNAKLWAMLSDVSQAMPEGRRHTPDDWKAIFMNACGWEVQFIAGLDGRPFPQGFRSSRMTKRQMVDLIEFIQAYGDAHGVRWSNEARES
jgi:hypothetical protein